MRESTHRGDFLISHIVICGGLVGIGTLHTDSVHLFVHFGTVVEAHGTRAGNSPSDTCRMPCTNASNLAETTMGLAGEARDAPTSDDTLCSSALGDGNGVDHLALGKDIGNGDGLFEQSRSKVDLIGNGSTIDLDFHDVGLLLDERSLADLSVSNDANDGAMLFHLFKLGLDLFAAIGVLLGVLGESLLLGLVPVLVEATADFIRKMLCPDGGERAEATSGLDVANNTDNDHGRGFDDGDCLGDFLLVGLGTRLFDITHDVRHAGFVTHEGGQMRRFGGVVARERLNLTLSALATLLGQEAKGAVARMLELRSGFEIVEVTEIKLPW